MIFKVPPVSENAIVYDDTGEYRHEGIDNVNFFMNNKDYRYHGYRRVNGIVWHFFEYIGNL